MRLFLTVALVALFDLAAGTIFVYNVIRGDVSDPVPYLNIQLLQKLPNGLYRRTGGCLHIGLEEVTPTPRTCNDARFSSSFSRFVNTDDWETVIRWVSYDPLLDSEALSLLSEY